MFFLQPIFLVVALNFLKGNESHNIHRFLLSFNVNTIGSVVVVVYLLCFRLIFIFLLRIFIQNIPFVFLRTIRIFMRPLMSIVKQINSHLNDMNVITWRLCKIFDSISCVHNLHRVIWKLFEISIALKQQQRTIHMVNTFTLLSFYNGI